MNKFKKIWKGRWVLRNLPQTIWFNFHYLPFKQAIKLPIVLYKPQFLSCKGTVTIVGEVKTAMIKMGSIKAPFYPLDGIKWLNDGKVVFKGKCIIGNNACISVAETGKIVFGDNFSTSAAFKIHSSCSIEFGDYIGCGWDCIFTDTDFHQMKHLNGSIGPKAYGPIKIGDNCWIGTRCTILKNSILPNKTTVASCSLVNKPYDFPEATIIAGQPAKPVKTGLYRDKKDDAIEYT